MVRLQLNAVWPEPSLVSSAIYDIGLNNTANSEPDLYTPDINDKECMKKTAAPNMSQTEFYNNLCNEEVWCKAVLRKPRYVGNLNIVSISFPSKIGHDGIVS